MKQAYYYCNAYESLIRDIDVSSATISTMQRFEYFTIFILFLIDGMVIL